VLRDPFAPRLLSFYYSRFLGSAQEEATQSSGWSFHFAFEGSLGARWEAAAPQGHGLTSVFPQISVLRPSELASTALCFFSPQHHAFPGPPQVVFFLSGPCFNSVSIYLRPGQFSRVDLLPVAPLTPFFFPVSYRPATPPPGWIISYLWGSMPRLF